MPLRKIRSTNPEEGAAIVYRAAEQYKTATEISRYGTWVAAKDCVGWFDRRGGLTSAVSAPEAAEFEALPFTTDLVDATPFGVERAKEIWEERDAENCVSHAVTPGEDSYIRNVWEGMPDNTSYMDAFFNILNDRVKL